MGLLDDAIRDHLELMRRHGADPAELERLERDALGPVRRRGAEPSEAGLTEEDESRAAGEEVDLAGPASERLEPQPLGEPLPPPDVADEMELEAEEAPVDEPDGEQLGAVGLAHEDADAGIDHRIGSDTSEAATAELAPSDADLGETAQFDVEAELRGERGGAADDDEEEEPASDDPLEETPEFLQDAPDHDRLWFEQRPPRDFDFGG
jgi:hypothetical protein